MDLQAAEQWRSNNTAAQKALAKALSIAGISEGARERMVRDLSSGGNREENSACNALPFCCWWSPP